jgi:hypothetical protein
MRVQSIEQFHDSFITVQSVRAPPPSSIYGSSLQQPNNIRPPQYSTPARHNKYCTALHSDASIQLPVHARLNSTTRQFHGPANDNSVGPGPGTRLCAGHYYYYKVTAPQRVH